MTIPTNPCYVIMSPIRFHSIFVLENTKDVKIGSRNRPLPKNNKKKNAKLRKAQTEMPFKAIICSRYKKLCQPSLKGGRDGQRRGYADRVIYMKGHMTLNFWYQTVWRSSL